MVIEELIVVLVESSAMQQKIIRARLDEVGVRHLHCAKSGAEGLKLIKELTPDLVLSAMYLDDMTGADLVLTMRRVEALSDIAFILVSSETSFRALDPIRQAGAIALLPKPFEADDLRRALYATVDYYQRSQDQIGEFDPADLSVLVVDDSGMARKHIMRVLGNLGIDHIDVNVHAGALGTGQKHVAGFLHAAQSTAPTAGHVDRALRQCRGTLNWPPLRPRVSGVVHYRRRRRD